MTIDLVLLHIGASNEARYVHALQAAGPVDVVRVVAGSLSASYDEKTGLAHDYPTLADFVRARMPDHQPDTPLVLVAFSAGCWAARAWMRDPESRAMTSVLLLLDGLHSGKLPDGSCNPEPLEGVLEYARLCRREPRSHLLFLTHTAIDPLTYASTTSCAKLFEPLEGNTVGVFGYNGTDAAAHVAQQATVGPDALEDIAQWLRVSWKQPPSSILGWILAALGTIGLGWFFGARRT